MKSNIENIYCSATLVDLKHILNHNPTPMKAEYLPLFNVNLSQLQLNSISTQFQLNFNSITSQPQSQPQSQLNLTLT